MNVYGRDKYTRTYFINVVIVLNKNKILKNSNGWKIIDKKRILRFQFFCSKNAHLSK